MTKKVTGKKATKKSAKSKLADVASVAAKTVKSRTSKTAASKASKSRGSAKKRRGHHCAACDFDEKLEALSETIQKASFLMFAELVEMYDDPVSACATVAVFLFDGGVNALRHAQHINDLDLSSPEASSELIAAASKLADASAISLIKRDGGASPDDAKSSHNETLN